MLCVPHLLTISNASNLIKSCFTCSRALFQLIKICTNTVSFDMLGFFLKSKPILIGWWVEVSNETLSKSLGSIFPYDYYHSICYKLINLSMLPALFFQFCYLDIIQEVWKLIHKGRLAWVSIRCIQQILCNTPTACMVFIFEKYKMHFRHLWLLSRNMISGLCQH